MFGMPSETALYWSNEIRIWAMVAAALAAVVTMGAGWAQVRLQSEVNARKDEALKRFQTEAGERIAAANQAAAEATAQAAASMVALEKLRAPREITDERIAAMVPRLAKFHGQTWALTTYWDLKEPLALSNRLKRLLDTSGWQYTQEGSEKHILGIITAIEVYVHPAALEATKAAAQELVSLLNAAETEAILKQQNDPNNPNNMLFLNVGIKP